MPNGKNHTPGQIIRHLRDADAAQAASRSDGQVCQEISVSDQTYYR